MLMILVCLCRYFTFSTLGDKAAKLDLDKEQRFEQRGDIARTQALVVVVVVVRQTNQVQLH